MRTTIQLPDELATAARRRALEQHTTFTAIVTDALRAALAAEPASDREHSPLPTFGASGPRPGVDLDDSASLRDLMDGA